jgi:hypothetical protein
MVYPTHRIYGNGCWAFRSKAWWRTTWLKVYFCVVRDKSCRRRRGGEDRRDASYWGVAADWVLRCVTLCRVLSSFRRFEGSDTVSIHPSTRLENPFDFSIHIIIGLKVKTWLVQSRNITSGKSRSCDIRGQTTTYPHRSKERRVVGIESVLHDRKSALTTRTARPCISCVYWSVWNDAWINSGALGRPGF